MNTRQFATAMAIGAMALTATAARAAEDNVGAAGAVVGVETNEDGSNEYFAARGRLFIDEGDVVRIYPWQGTACNGLPINDQQVDILLETMNKKANRVIPYWRLGAGGARCLVGFTVARSAKMVPLVARP